MDSSDVTRGNYNIIRAKAHLEDREQAARLVAVFAAIIGALLVGAAILASDMDLFARIALFTSGQTCLIWAGIMIVGWGASGGHLIVVRTVEQCNRQVIEKMDTAISVGERNGQIIGDVLEDEISRRRNGSR